MRNVLRQRNRIVDGVVSRLPPSRKPLMTKKPPTAQSPKLSPPMRGSEPKPPKGQEWETITSAANSNRSALRLFERGSNPERIVTIHPPGTRAAPCAKPWANYPRLGAQRTDHDRPARRYWADYRGVLV